MIRARYRTLPEILARAKAEIERNPTITVYGWRDGAEWNRRQTEPWESFRRQMQKLGQAIAREQRQRVLAATPAPKDLYACVPVPETRLQRLSAAPRLSEEPGEEGTR